MGASASSPSLSFISRINLAFKISSGKRKKIYKRLPNHLSHTTIEQQSWKQEWFSQSMLRSKLSK
jgi:hypothetical protein